MGKSCRSDRVRQLVAVRIELVRDQNSVMLFRIPLMDHKTF